MTNKNDKLIYHLFWMLDQYGNGTDEESKQEIYKTRSNADAHAVDTLLKLKCVKLIKGSWPATKFITYTLTDLGKLAKYRNDLFD